MFLDKNNDFKEVVSSGDAEAPEDEDDSDEDEDFESKILEEKPSEEQDQIVSSIEHTQKDLLIQEELRKMMEDETFEGFEQDDPMPEANAIEDDAENPEVPLGTVLTLAEVLKEAGLESYAPSKNDDESRMLTRIRLLCWQMQAFVSLVRIEEGILSRASIVGMKRPSNQHNTYEHQLALARAAFQISSGRQSRHSLWCNFSQRAVKDVAEELSSVGISECSVQAPDAYKISKEVDGFPQRTYQLLVVKPTQIAESCGGLRFALTVSAWRAGRNKKSAQGQKPVGTGTMPAHLVTFVHVRLLMPSPECDQTYFGTWHGLSNPFLQKIVLFFSFVFR